MSKQKILIVRFNSIGDIVLTSPVIRALDEEGYEVHYLSKKSYRSLLLNNPRVKKHFSFDGDLNEVIELLKAEGYAQVIDLHNNYRSKKVSKALKLPTHVLKKNPVRLFFMTQFNMASQQQEHIVDRFMSVVSPLIIKKTKPQVEFYISDESKERVNNLNLPEQYITISVGAAFETKQIPIPLMQEIIEKIDLPVVLLGGRDDITKAKVLKNHSPNGIINLCGDLNIEDSAEVIGGSKVLLSGDTGLMHIAAALDTNIVAIYGSTHPILGYTPYYNKNNKSIIVENNQLKCRPCTKQGRDTCPKGHFKCMKDLDSSLIIDKIYSLIYSHES
ncbi:glycosyltransferase family 9 protein [Saprospiraceae bacterium]|nr:glycosyltransferase family 9 protein [Saprospiraceae bacterium]